MSDRSDQIATLVTAVLTVLFMFTGAVLVALVWSW